MMAIATKERPIIFGTESIRAILASRKTQTRRVVKLPKWAHPDDRGDDLEGDSPLVCHRDTGCLVSLPCPYGVPGDRLWVREMWTVEDAEKLKLAAYEGGQNPDWIYYRDPIHENTGLKWRSPIHMPRWASRITLENTGVWVERLHALNEADALADGGWTYRECPIHKGPVLSFVAHWDRINGKKYPWESNPWVWVIEFKRITP